MRQGADRVARWCGTAAVTGGAMWAAKGVAILITGDQPPLLFEVPLVLFPIGLLGLHRRLGDRGSGWVRYGGTAAWAALASGVITGLTVVLAGKDAPEVLVGSGIAITALGTVLGLLLLGKAARVARLFPGRWRSLPLALGLSTIPAVSVVGGALEAIHERLLELPLVVIALGWILLGRAITTLPRPHPPGRLAA